MNDISLLVGSYAPKGAPGILRATLHADAEGIDFEPLCTELENPSWLTLHPNGRVLYAVEERVPDGAVVALVRHGEGWEVARRMSAGSSPCHIALAEREQFLFVSNYMDGSLGVYRLDAEGIPLEQTDLRRHAGHGPNPERQEHAHVHSSLWLDGTLFVADLGIDRLAEYRLHREEGTLELLRQIVLPAGSGPRHIAIHPAHPEYLYVNSELSGQAFVVHRSTGECVQDVAAIPEDYSGDFRVSSIKFAGDTLYVGARELDAVCMFALDDDGLPGKRSICRLRQQTPRDVWMNADWCVTADEGSQGLTLLRREGSTLRECGFFPTPGIHPACLLPIS